MRIAVGLLTGTLFLLVSICSWADDEKLEFFEKKIRPVFVTYCYECHSSDSTKLGGALLLDSRDGVRKGGETGSVIREGIPDESLLVKAVRYTDDNVKMPPKGKLPDSVIADIELWVKQGAFDPRDHTTTAKPVKPWNDILKERRDWWSLKPVSKPVIPNVQDESWSTSPVDRFILAKLTENGLTPELPADARTFARRLSLVLTGLPPKIEDVDRFVVECHSSASSDPLPKTVVERYVDSLLESPHFGEQWARHWLDVVRFSETHGNEWNYEVHHAWRYRDYLIRAFNNDVPYDQFIREHIAGDLLPKPRLNVAEHFNESVIGTGFYRFGEVNHDDCISLRSLGYDLADNQIDTLTKAFQATTVACARCHNHKLDAISSEDYYAMLAILRSSRNASHCIDTPEVNAAQKQQMKAVKVELRRELASTWKSEASQFSRYMQAANAVRGKRSNAIELSAGLDPQRLEKWLATLAAEKTSFDDPFEAWRRLSAVEAPAATAVPADATAVSPSFPEVWKALVDQFAKENREQTEFNQSRFVRFGDFRRSGLGGSPDFPVADGIADWRANGQAMTDESSQSGDFVVNHEGETIVQTILPTGRFTNAISSKLNGTLRSPVLPSGKKYISFQVLGQRSSAVRLVSNNCQLNYANYRALTSPDLQWVTFSPPDDRESLRTYAELMTMFDNPKFPDQLSPLGGDNANYKMPWDKAAENPRSYFGVTQVVLHDCPETPKPSLSHLAELYGGERKAESPHPSPLPAKPGRGSESDAESPFSERPQRGGEGVSSVIDIVERTAFRMNAAIDAWSNDRATDDDVRWLDSMIRRDLIGNKITQTARSEAVVKEYRKLDSELSIPRVSVGVADGGPGVAQPVFIRGDCNRPGETVPRRFLEVLSNSTEPFSSTGSGRLELAERIATVTNPLTARVMVNRIWHHLFGTGLVRTVDDFGHVGETPSNPELLDYLASQFVEDGWSVKRLIRSLVLTRTFQMSNHVSALSHDIDPQNRLLQHYPARRMDAEMVRDSILSASGRLDTGLYGQSIQPYREKEYVDRRLFPGPLDGNGRRSIYIKNNLMEAPKFLAAFNFPGGKVTQGRRDVTNVPAQALALLNDPFVLQQAEVWARSVLQKPGDSMATRVDTMFRASVGRSPTAEEQSRFEKTIRQLADLYKIPNDGIMSSPELWKDVAHALFNFSELIYIP